jgi:hypothetical protein
MVQNNREWGPSQLGCKFIFHFPVLRDMTKKSTWKFFQSIWKYLRGRKIFQKWESQILSMMKKQRCFCFSRVLNIKKRVKTTQERKKFKHIIIIWILPSLSICESITSCLQSMSPFTLHYNFTSSLHFHYDFYTGL